MATPGKFDINPATGKQYGVNPASGVQDDNYWANTVEPALKAAAGDSSYSSGNYADIAKQALAMQQEANQPVIKSLEASLPEITQRYSTERSRLSAQQPTLEARYDQLINDIKGNQSAAESRTGIATSQELGRRGISSEGGLFAKTVNDALNPVTREYSGLINTAGLSREDAIRQLQDTITALVGEETGAKRDVSNTIAGVQSSGSQAALSNAMSMYSLESQARESALNRALQEQSLGESSRQNAITNALDQAKLAETQREFDISATKTGTSRGTQLEYKQVTNDYGDQILVGYDPYTGEIKSRKVLSAKNIDANAEAGNTGVTGIINSLRAQFGL